QSAPSAPPSPPRPSLASIVAPEQLGKWQLKGSISRSHHHLRIFRYQDTKPKHPLDVSIYPLPNGWNQFSETGSIQRQFGMLSHLIKRSAYEEYHATKVTSAKPVSSTSLVGNPV